MPSVPLVNHVAVGGGDSRIDGISHAPVQMADEHVAGPRGAVVVEIVVAVRAVGRQVVLVDGLEDGCFLAGREAERLLHHTAAVAGILHEEHGERLDAHLIVGEAKDKAQCKILLPEAEHAVVDGQVLLAGGVAQPYGRVAVEAPHLVARRTSEQTDFHAVHSVVAAAVAGGPCTRC